jgi:hypothetical protein
VPTTAYLWDCVAPTTLTTRSYVEFSNELDTLVPSSVSTSVSYSVLYGSLETQCHEYLVFAGYLKVVRGA